MQKIDFRIANISDAEIYYKWINDKIVREQSFNSDLIKWDAHLTWFKDKVSDPQYYFYIFYNDEKKDIGQVRIQNIDNINSIIGVSIDENFRGHGYGAKILEIACNDHLSKIPNIIINAYIKEENKISKLIFEKAGFNLLQNIIYNNFNCFHYIFYANRKV
jgi:RimJ/RimL family protein N-acetyltransferase